MAKFMVNQMVMRGSSIAQSTKIIQEKTYRNSLSSAFAMAFQWDKISTKIYDNKHQPKNSTFQWQMP